MQDGHKIPKWNPREKCGQFMGFYPFHYSTLGLIRNLRTGSVTPQYHVVHDYLFQTVSNAYGDGLDGNNPPLKIDLEIFFKQIMKNT